MRRSQDGAGVVEGRIRRLAMDRQVFTCLDELDFRAVELDAAGFGEPGLALRHLLVGIDARIGSRVHQCRDALFGEFLKVADLVAAQWRRGVDDPLQVDIRAALGDEVPHILEALVAGELGQLARHAKVGLIVGDRRESTLCGGARIDLQERIGVGGGHVRMLELHPGIDAVHDVAIFARTGPPPLVIDDQLAARQRVVDHVVVAFLVAERRVGVHLPDRLGRRRHVGAGCDLLARPPS